MAGFGSVVPARLGNTPMVPTFPQQQATYTDTTGAIVVPSGALDRWYAYRATKGAARGDAIGIGDSTMYGSGGPYSFLQRLRDRSVSFGMADGGKGLFAGGEGAAGSPILYDAPEINGFVSTNWAGFTDSYDPTDGQFYYDDGTTANRQLVLQFRQTCARLWYMTRADAGDFTYVVQDGATTVASGTVQAYSTGIPNTGQVPKFVWISGLAANTTHTLTVTNLATSTNGGSASGTRCWVALAPMNVTGLAWQKFATSGDTISNHFYSGIASSPYTQSLSGMRYQAPFGLTPTATASPTYRGAPVDTTQPAAGAINPVVALTNLGFNDLSNAAAGDEAMWTEYVKKFAGACGDAAVDGIVIAGQLPYNDHWPTFGAARFNVLKTQALASGLTFVDLFYPIAGPSLSYSGGTSNPHLTKAQYQTQADFLWDNLLGL